MQAFEAGSSMDIQAETIENNQEALFEIFEAKITEATLRLREVGIRDEICEAFNHSLNVYRIKCYRVLENFERHRFNNPERSKLNLLASIAAICQLLHHWLLEDSNPKKCLSLIPNQTDLEGQFLEITWGTEDEVDKILNIKEIDVTDTGHSRIVLDEDISPTMTQYSSVLELFTQRHDIRDARWTEELVQHMLSKPGIASYFAGMFASKTGAMQEGGRRLIDLLLNYDLRAYVAKGVNRNEIKGRAKTDLEAIPAIEIAFHDLMAELEDWVDQLSRQTEQAKTPILIIDEITFFAHDEEKIAALVQILGELKALNARILIGGLNRNYRGQLFPLIPALEAAGIVDLRFDGVSFRYYSVNGQSEIKHAAGTARHLRLSGGAQIIDFLNPIVFGDKHETVIYEPADINPYFELAEINPALTEYLLGVDDEELAMAIVKQSLL